MQIGERKTSRYWKILISKNGTDYRVEVKEW